MFSKSVAVMARLRDLTTADLLKLNPDNKSSGRISLDAWTGGELFLGMVLAR